MSVLKSSEFYKPFTYPWADEYELQHNKMFWLPDEVPLNKDVEDWNTKLSEEERNLLTHIFRFFTQADVEVSNAYCNKYFSVIKNGEIQRMMSDFASREGIHVRAYARIVETLPMPDTVYNQFMNYKAMKDKHDYFEAIPCDKSSSISDIARSIAVFSAFCEGLQLFASFAILLNFQRHGKMNGMGQIVAWSQRDESLHVEAMIKVFRTLIEEHPRIVNDEFKKSLYDIARNMVKLEDLFIDLAFEQGGIENLTPEEVKEYIRYIADRRLVQLGLKENFGVEKNPLPWVDYMVSGNEHANFFEQKPTAYTKGGVEGDELF